MPSNLQSGPTRPADLQSPEKLEPPVLWTMGHSTRSIEDFIELLAAHAIQMLADVRKIPYSRHNPQFNQDSLTKSLQNAEIQYRHLPGLGGRRKTRQDSENVGWRNASFRGYADYMQTGPFQNELADLMMMAQNRPVAIMCAEAVPWRCHRFLISDALVSRGWTVRHIISATSTQTHTLTPFAKLKEGRLTYPADNPANPSLRLF